MVVVFLFLFVLGICEFAYDLLARCSFCCFIADFVIGLWAVEAARQWIGTEVLFLLF